jgi:cation transport ATPase
MGCGADISRESADVCLVKNDLMDLPWVLDLSRKTVRTVRLNLFWAFAYNVAGVGLAMTGRLSPVFAALAMVASSLLVVAHSLRLGRVPIGGES